MSQPLVENSQIVAGIIPIDLGAGANTGDWVSMASYRRCAIVFFSGIGTAAQDATITVLQATAAAGTGSKACNFTDVFVKEGATALSAIANFTKTVQADGNTYISTTGAENEQLVVIEIADTDLDVANGFDFISVTIADTGAAAQVGCVLYILTEPRYGATVASMPSAIA